MQQRQALNAARDFVDEFADEDDEFDLYQTLVGDEQFQALAFELQQLDIYQPEFEGHVATFANSARENLQLALEERSAQVEAEVVDE
jgi:hypothetical protein